MSLPAPSASPAVPVEVHEAPSQTCTLCRGPLLGSTATTNLQPLCSACVGALQGDLVAQAGTNSDLVVGTLGAIVGAIVAAALWAVLEVITEVRIGFIAVGVGWAVGQIMRLGAGRARNAALQTIAAAVSVGGLVLARYFVFAHWGKEQLAASGLEIGYFDSDLVSGFLASFGELLSPFDALWVFLAASAAWKLMAPSRVKLEL
ncbi:MAG: hypothetical protein WBV82_05990 [Myxococcaceae bacterium]